MDILQSIKDWWHIILFILSTIVAFILGRAKQAWKIEILADKTEAIEQRVSVLEKSMTDEAVTLAEIKVQLANVLRGIDDLSKDVKGKADK